ncbi:RNase adapter RapZ [Neofamilia massiliensis]|uniref:RNase adapter RapZ n=1 Tax=Neofamilia massiliensis TaxID=1673724 RepID=UPI0006BB89F3|nr:RNase adapter RapZ [Neofamilia massiliensis]
MEKNIELIVISGISGAGKSTALRAVEDLGYYCMDNIPPQLLTTFVQLYVQTKSAPSKAAVVLDIRTREFFEDISLELEKLKKLGVDYKLIFLEAADETVVNRYQEMRRPHPLAADGNILDGLKEERKKLQAIKKLADYIIDTSRMNNYKLRAEINNILELGSSQMQVSIVSFGFKNGILLDADYVFDIRFIPNPYYIKELKPQSGKDPAVKDYVFSFDDTKIFMDKIEDLIKFVVPRYIKEGRLQLTVGIGCTGGRHRSVALSEELKNRLKDEDIKVVVDHRDLDR